MQQAVASYGYLALFAGTFLEGESFFILGGVAARHGLLDPWLVALTALGGGLLGDQIFFLLGRWRGVEILSRSRRLARKAVVARRLVRRHAVALMLCSRFLYGLRTAIPLACGAAGIPLGRFLLLNFISALLWTLCFGSLGYWLGGWMVEHLGAMQGLQVVAVLLVAVVALGILAARLIQRRLAGPDPPTSS
ncbi:MAG: DedA family protein [Thermodesulfobacteriota bacterium]